MTFLEAVWESEGVGIAPQSLGGVGRLPAPKLRRPSTPSLGRASPGFCQGDRPSSAVSSSVWCPGGGLASRCHLLSSVPLDFHDGLGSCARAGPLALLFVDKSALFTNSSAANHFSRPPGGEKPSTCSRPLEPEVALRWPLGKPARYLPPTRLPWTRRLWNLHI